MAAPPPFGAFAYVIDGAVKMGLEGRPARTLRAGDFLYEPPNAVHTLSENASQTEPASLLVVFVVPEGEVASVAA